MASYQATSISVALRRSDQQRMIEIPEQLEHTRSFVAKSELAGWRAGAGDDHDEPGHRDVCSDPDDNLFDRPQDQRVPAGAPATPTRPTG
jgi:hypothetical protein